MPWWPVDSTGHHGDTRDVATTDVNCYYLRMDASTEINRETLPADQVALAVEVFRMLADGTRIQILWSLIDRELPVNEIAATIGKPGPSVSQHLAKLRMARLVRTRRDGTQIFYQLENDHIRELIVDAVHNAEHAGPSIPAHHLRGGDAAAVPMHPTPSTSTGS
jgi:DNA-binding transcriptional ArsR family regulator